MPAIGQTVGSSATQESTLDFSTIKVTGLPTNINGFFDVKAGYGAKGDGVTDDTAAIQAAINAAQNAGGGIVWLAAGVYVITGTLTVTGSYVRIKGAGLWSTQIKITANNINGITFTGTQPAPAKYCGLEDLFIWNVTVGTTNTGLSLNYAKLFTCKNVQIADFITGMAQVHSPNCVFEFIEVSYSGSGSAIGFAIDGSTPFGNVSTVWRDCYFAGTSSSQTTIGFSIYSTAANGDCGDLNFFNCGSSQAGLGMTFDFTNTNATTSTDCSSDIIVRDCVHDEFFQYGVRLLNGNATTLVKIEGGYFNANNATTTTAVGVYTAVTALIEGAEFIPPQIPFGSPAQSAYAVWLASGDGSVVSGCSINGWTRGVYVNGANRPTILGNRFFSTPNSGFGIAMAAINVFNCNNPTIIGNSFGASALHGMNVAINLDATVAGTPRVIGNTFYPAANIDAVFSNSAPTAHAYGNAGYNPVGKIAAAAVPASGTAYTNNTGVDLTINIFTGAAVTVSVIAIGGQATSLSMAASAQLSVLVPAGQTITLTYAGGTPTWSFFGN